LGVKWRFFGVKECFELQFVVFDILEHIKNWF
jgi:hypothetical protein